jgi:hypothetical protein
VRFHGGKVRALNRVQGGLTVEIRLPLIGRGQKNRAAAEPVPLARQA